MGRAEELRTVTVAGFLRGVTSLREGVFLYTMNPLRIANKLRGECSYHTPIRVVLSTKKLSICVC
jgi:hypothetical protein